MDNSEEPKPANAPLPLSRREDKHVSEEEYQKLVELEGQFWGGEVHSPRSAFRRLLNRLGLEPNATEYRSFGNFTLRLIAGFTWFRAEFRHLKGRKRIMEVGCNGGAFALELARRNTDSIIDACDVAKKSIDAANLAYEKEKAKGRQLGELLYAVRDVNRMDVLENEYDAIVANGTLHHLMEIEGVVEKFKIMLKPDGLLICMDENHVGNEENRRAALLLLPLLFPIYVIKKRKAPTFQNLVDLTEKLFEWRYIRPTPFEEVTEGADLIPLLEKNFDIIDRRHGRCLIDALTRSLNILAKCFGAILIKPFDSFLIWTGWMRGRNIFIVARNKKTT